MISEAEQLGRFRNSGIDFPPLRLRLVDALGAARPGLSGRPDAIISARWGEREFRFAVECKGRSTPRILQEGVAQARAWADPPQTYPMVMVPYLSRKQLADLEAAGVSGIDACGNGVVVVPGELLVLRTGQRNKYPDSAPLKNVYRDDASLVARALLLTPEYPTVSAIRDEIRDRGGRLALSTVSKALRRLEDDLMITRRRGRIRVLQPDELLQKLAQEYRPPKLTRPPFLGRSPLPTDALMARVVKLSKDFDVRIAATGAGSVQQYAVMAREPMVGLYCSDVPSIFNTLSVKTEIEVTNVFPNIQLLETRAEFVYFDTRPDEDGSYPWASPIQVYLELSSGDKRDRETAEQVTYRIRDWNAEYRWPPQE